MKYYTKSYVKITIAILALFHIIYFFLGEYSPLKLIMHQVLISLVLMGAILYSYKTFFSNKESIKALLEPNKKLLFPIFVSIIIVLIFTILWAYITLKYNPQTVINLQSSFQFYKDNLWYLLFLCLIMPISEELLCRGVFCQNHDSFKKAIKVSSILFYVCHINFFSSTFIPGLNVLILGIFFSYLFIKTNSLIPSIVAHIATNILSIFLIPIFTYFSVI